MPKSDRWLVITAHAAPGDPLRDLISEGLIAAGATSVLEEPSGITTYLPPPDGDVEQYVRSLAASISDASGQAAPQLSWRWQVNEDWERGWRRGLQPRKVSSRFVVKPSWTDWSAAAGEVVIEIDPQMAFGTGEHATTRGCLRLLDLTIAGGDRVLDIGSGSAILAIAAALTGASEVIAVEFDADANINARENIDRNGVGARIELLEQMADADLLSRLGHFDLILANILSGVIRPLLPAITAALRPGGRAILSGILQTESGLVIADAERAGLDLLKEDREDEWWSGLLQRA